MTLTTAPWVESSQEVVTRTRTLLVDTRKRIVINRRLLNPWWTLSGGSDEDRDSQLIPSVRDRLERGVLDPAPQEVLAGNGTGRTCIVCARVISPDQIENEVVVRTNGIVVTLRAHLPCYNIWRWESATFARAHSRLLPETLDAEST